ncbi:MAG: hypothetical protein ABF659_09430, partial [Acetobacter orientalis]
ESSRKPVGRRRQNSIMTLFRSSEGPKAIHTHLVPVTTGENDMNGTYLSTLPSANRQTAHCVAGCA